MKLANKMANRVPELIKKALAGDIGAIAMLTLIGLDILFNPK